MFQHLSWTKKQNFRHNRLQCCIQMYPMHTMYNAYVCSKQQYSYYKLVHSRNTGQVSRSVNKEVLIIYVHWYTSSNRFKPPAIFNVRSNYNAHVKSKWYVHGDTKYKLKQSKRDRREQSRMKQAKYSSSASEKNKVKQVLAATRKSGKSDIRCKASSFYMPCVLFHFVCTI